MMTTNAHSVVLPLCSAAVATLGIIAGAAPAHATPLAPPPACNYELPPFLTLNQDNNIFVEMATADNKLVGTARYNKNGAPESDETFGTAIGGLNGRGFNFFAHWNNGFTNSYYGSVGDDGSLTGYTVNSNSDTNNWTASGKLNCDAPTTPPPPPVQSPDAGQPPPPGR